MARPRVEVRRSSDDELEAWLDVVVDGVAHPRHARDTLAEQFPREMIKGAKRDLVAAGVTRYITLHNGVIISSAGLRIAEGVARFTGAPTTPTATEVSTSALLSARLADTTAADCDIAVVTPSPESKSQENAQRRGFDLLHQAVPVKQPDFALEDVATRASRAPATHCLRVPGVARCRPDRACRPSPRPQPRAGTSTGHQGLRTLDQWVRGCDASRGQPDEVPGEGAWNGHPRPCPPSRRERACRQ